MSDLAVLFPGQGSQFVGMGAELARAYPAAGKVFERADEVLGFRLSELCWEGPEEELKQTQNAQPAILVHSLAVWAAVEHSLAKRVGYAAGHSLGEFSAYAAAGSLTLEDAVHLVRRRGELMAEARAGTMAAVVGLDPAAIETICEEASDGNGVVVAANYNSRQQIVVSGDMEAVDRASELAKAAGAKMVRPLAVSGAFHSPLMTDAEAGLREALARVEFEPPRFPVVCNVTAEPVTDAELARAMLVRQLTAPVRWTEGILEIAAAGIQQFVEVGPGKVLTGLLRRIDPEFEGRAVGTPQDVEQVMREKQ
ncbi:MAG: ACP S-malonyltransferase [Gemmatimonadales bacterium]